MQRLGLCILDVEAVNAFSTGHLSTSNTKAATVASLENSFPDVFKDGLGQCTVTTATLTLKQKATPVYRRARPVPYTSLPIGEQELDRLLNVGFIKPVSHADWAAAVMAVKEPDGLAQLCVDYSTGLNEELQLHQHPLPVPDDIFATLNGVMCSYEPTSPMHIYSLNSMMTQSDSAT